MSNDSRIGRVTIPTDVDVVPETLELVKRWGADDGIGSLQVDEQKYPLKTDDILIINPNVKHTETSSADHKLSYIVLGLERSYCNGM